MKYPFVYYGDGSYSVKKGLDSCLWFKQKIPLNERKIIEASIPSPLRQRLNWLENAIFLSSSEAYDYEVASFVKSLKNEKRENDDYDPSGAEWEEYDRILEENLRKIHQKYPIAFFYKPASVEKKSEYTPWHVWSIENFPNQVLPYLLEYINSKKDSMAEAMGYFVNNIFENYLKAYTQATKQIQVEFADKILLFIEHGLSSKAFFLEDIVYSTKVTIFNYSEIVYSIIEKTEDGEKGKILANSSALRKALFSLGEFRQTGKIDNPSERLPLIAGEIRKIETRLAHGLAVEIAMKLMKIQDIFKFPQKISQENIMAGEKIFSFLAQESEATESDYYLHLKFLELAKKETEAKQFAKQYGKKLKKAKPQIVKYAESLLG